MQTDSDTQEHEPNETASSLQSNLIRISLGFYGILLPIISLFTAVIIVPGLAVWQSGEWTDKLSFVLLARCGWPVYPFSIFAMVSMWQVIRNETDAISQAWVRFGIFSGVLVCGWYVFALSSTVFDSPFSAIGLLFLAAIWLVLFHSFLFIDTEPITLILILITEVILIAIITIVILSAASSQGLISLFAICQILSAPLAFIVYLGMSIRILKLHGTGGRLTLSLLMVWVSWFAAFAAALQKTIALSFAEYSQLPIEPLSSDCYVVNAASKGYPAIVGSQTLPTETNQPVIVNKQLATFKAAELTLRAISPKSHRWFRSIYDRIGPVAAARLRSPLRATAAYLSLKPAEWLCRIALRILLGRETYQLAKQLYLSRAKSNRRRHTL